MLKFNKKNESGRSMVEMLGVLAVIGVLSVMGIAGYTVAMNSHRTNEVLNQASRLAMIVSAQKQAGSTNPVLSDSDRNASGQYQFELTNGTGSFTLTAKNVPDGVRARLNGVNMAGVTIDASTANVTFTFSDDLGNGSITPTYDDNIGAKVCSSNDDCSVGCEECNGGKCVSICPTGQYCTSYATCSSIPSCEGDEDSTFGCCKNNISVAPRCPEGAYFEGDMNSCMSSLGGWTSFEGMCEDDIKSCQTNADCNTPSEYCEVLGDGSYGLGSGTCQPVGTITTIENQTGSAAKYNGYFYSNLEFMTWFSAVNWCKSQGGHLIYMSDLGITGGIIGEIIEENGRCTGSSCIGVDWSVLKSVFSGYSFLSDSPSGSTTCYEIGFTDEMMEEYEKTVLTQNYAVCKK